MKSLRVDHSQNGEADMGPLITAAHRAKVVDYIAAGVAEGARLVVDGRGHKVAGYENGFFLGGSLFDGVTPAMKIYREEIFGPVLVVVRVPTLADAIEAREFARVRERHRRVHARWRRGARLRAGDRSRHGGRQRADSRADGVFQLRRLAAFELLRPRHAWHGRRAFLHAPEDRHQPLARPMRRGSGSAEFVMPTMK